VAKDIVSIVEKYTDVDKRIRFSITRIAFLSWTGRNIFHIVSGRHEIPAARIKLIFILYIYLYTIFARSVQSGHRHVIWPVRKTLALIILSLTSLVLKKPILPLIPASCFAGIKMVRSRYCYECHARVIFVLRSNTLCRLCIESLAIPYKDRLSDRCSICKRIRLIEDFPFRDPKHGFRALTGSTCHERRRESYRDQKGKPVSREKRKQ